jgi:hypothetical protein
MTKLNQAPVNDEDNDKAHALLRDGFEFMKRGAQRLGVWHQVFDLAVHGANVRLEIAAISVIRSIVKASI